MDDTIRIISRGRVAWGTVAGRCPGYARAGPKFALLGLLLWMTACASSDLGGEAPGNQPPVVWLAAAPPSGTVQQYKIHLFWGGWDPDGDVAYYEYAISDNEDRSFNPADTVGHDKWLSVYTNDSTFTFTADVLVDSNTIDTVSEFQRSHTFFIRAVDREGLASRDPARRSFTAFTLSPQIFVTAPRRSGRNPALVPTTTTFRWEATDFVVDLSTKQEPESTQYALVSTSEFQDDWLGVVDYLRKVPAALNRFGKTARESDAEWSPWTWYGAPDDSGKFWRTPELALGEYVFAIRAKDEAGAVTPVLDEVENVRRLRVTSTTVGPVLTLINDYFGYVVSSSCDNPATILDIPGGVPLSFLWKADASGYGGTVAGYRYGWDIRDVNDPEQWETDFTPFTSEYATAPTREFAFGTHTFAVEVVDDSGNCSRAILKVNMVQFTLDRNLLLIDDFVADEVPGAGWSYGGGVIPNNQEHNDFWLQMIGNVDGFSPVGDIVQVTDLHPLSLEQIGSYKSVIWSVYADVGNFNDLSLLHSYVMYHRRDVLLADGKQEPNVLALLMAAGGHVLITGRHPVSTVLNRRQEPQTDDDSPERRTSFYFPLMFRYDMEGGQLVQPNIQGARGAQFFGYRELCLETLDFAILDPRNTRSEHFVCTVFRERPVTLDRTILQGMRAGIPLDPAFPRIELRRECAYGGNHAYSPNVRSYEVEVYNTQFFFDLCVYAVGSRDCFEPIYGLECLDTDSPHYGQPVAFWTSAYADRTPAVAGGVAARSAVFGFPPVYFEPAQVKPGIQHILFCEWQLPSTTPVSCPH